MNENELKSILQKLPSYKAPKGFKAQVLNIIEQQQSKKKGLLPSQNRISILTVLGLLIIPFLVLGIFITFSSMTGRNPFEFSETFNGFVNFKTGSIVLCSLVFWSTVDQYTTVR